MTRKMILIASAATMVLAGPAMADKGGHGGGNGNGGGGGGGGNRPQAQQPQPQQPQQHQRQERQAPPQRAERQQMQQMQRQERPQRAERQMQRMERPQRQERQAQAIERPQRQERQMQRMERPQRQERQAQRELRQPQVDRQQQQVERQAQRNEQQPRFDRQQQRFERQANRDSRQVIPTFDRHQGKFDRQVAGGQPGGFDAGRQRLDERALRPSAPLFASREMRPMKSFRQQFANREAVTIGQRIAPSYALAPVPSYFAANYADTPNYYYRYDDRLGSVYRIDRGDNVVRSLIPLFGGYSVGNPWPQTYYSSYVPAGYQDYYYDTPDYYYRNDGYGIYQVDGRTQLITALVALITGQGFGVGQYLPASYDAYNVPLDYRERYADDGDNWYRYGDGYIYRVDPRNRQISARYPIYGDQYAYDVGQPWPAAYPDYNVPYAYRTEFYDTPQYQYRYADGGIYQVDPTNQVILALVALLSNDRFAIGQPMPAGYDMYNVPFDYRDRYADTDRDWYRYANGSVYQINPASGLIEEVYPV